ncbi:unnamed protein product [Dibothriocephalus latus]|uniref:Protein kinase domain-containing protein n=1 Tax=Dibothriocephalus latus TaxID=60516 RepID=A0A3P7P6B5_DIBLA|nr:unnamed protein product [Dibothriocephalus latus]
MRKQSSITSSGDRNGHFWRCDPYTSRVNGSVVVADLGLALLTRPPEVVRDIHGYVRTTAPTCRMGERYFFAGGTIKEVSSDEDAQPEYEVHPSLSPNCQRRKKRNYRVLGSPFWMAPEMFSLKPYDESVDIYSFGVILCQLIGRVDADPDVLERSSSTLSIDMNKFLKTHVPEDAPRELVELAIACTRLESDYRSVHVPLFHLALPAPLLTGLWCPINYPCTLLIAYANPYLSASLHFLRPVSVRTTHEG